MEALEHDGGGIRARCGKHWSTTLQTKESGFAGAIAIAFAHGMSLFMRSGEDFFVKKFGAFGKTKYFCREIHS